MMFLQRISNSIRAMWRGALMPFSRVKTQFTQLRTNNMFTRTAQRFSIMRNRFGYYMDLPKRYLGISGKGQGQKTKSDDKKDKARQEEDSGTSFRKYELGSNVEQMHQRLRRKQRYSDVSVAQHTQIHLVDRTSGQQEILHLGFSSGRTKAQYTVNDEMLVFAQAQEENDILISSQSPDVKLNGHPLTRSTTLLQGSELNVRGRRYRVDLQVNERLGTDAFVHAVWDTDIGPVRRENEDAVGVYRDDDIYLFAVADGVGSGYSGDKMSAYAINYLLSAINLNHNKPVAWENVLYKASQNANIEVRNFLRKIQQHGGTTLTAFIMDGWVATILHVGDSRLYLLRNGILQQITQDHSEEIPSDDVETSDVVETQIRLSKAIGKTSYIEPDLMTLKLQPDDRLLLCTDGITGQIDDEELLQYLLDAPIRNLARELIEVSNERKNTDNASVVVIDILDHQTRDTEWEAKSKPRVYTGDSARLIELKKIEKSNLEKQSREQDKSSEDNENELGCSCLVLSLLITVLVLAVIWGSGFLYTWLDIETSSQRAEQVREASPTADVVNTVTLIPRSTRSETILTEEVATIVLTPDAASVTEQIVATTAPNSTSLGQINIEIVSPTMSVELGVTSTVRPTNPPR